MINDSVASDNCRYGSRITDKDGIETQTLDYSTPSTDFFINNAWVMLIRWFIPDIIHHLRNTFLGRHEFLFSVFNPTFSCEKLKESPLFLPKESAQKQTSKSMQLKALVEFLQNMLGS